jgi:hypothetical protein
MTTDVGIGSLVAYALAVLAVWFAAVTTLTVAAEPTRTVVVFGGNAAVLDAVVGSNVSLLGGSGRTLTVVGATPGFVRELYARGAWLVLPATGGCRGSQAVPRRG